MIALDVAQKKSRQNTVFMHEKLANHAERGFSVKKVKMILIEVADRQTDWAGGICFMFFFRK